MYTFILFAFSYFFFSCLISTVKHWAVSLFHLDHRHQPCCYYQDVVCGGFELVSGVSMQQYSPLQHNYNVNHNAPPPSPFGLSLSLQHLEHEQAIVSYSLCPAGGRITASLDSISHVNYHAYKQIHATCIDAHCCPRKAKCKPRRATCISLLSPPHFLYS